MKDLGKYYPPGYEWREELISAAALLGVAFLISWKYLFSLGRAVDALYRFEGAERVLKPDAVAEPFSALAGDSWQGFLLPVLFLAAMTVWHYVGYFRRTKSIYVMRRLPKRGALFLSCVEGPAVCAGLLALAAALLYGLYFGLYLFAVPVECRIV